MKIKKGQQWEEIATSLVFKIAKIDNKSIKIKREGISNNVSVENFKDLFKKYEPIKVALPSSNDINPIIYSSGLTSLDLSNLTVLDGSFVWNHSPNNNKQKTEKMEGQKVTIITYPYNEHPQSYGATIESIGVDSLKIRSDISGDWFIIDKHTGGNYAREIEDYQIIAENFGLKMFLVHYVQLHDGCDHSISCGERLSRYFFKSKKALIKHLKNNFSESDDFKFIDIYEPKTRERLPILEWYDEIEQKKIKKEQSKKEKEERELLEQLKAKYE